MKNKERLEQIPLNEWVSQVKVKNDKKRRNIRRITKVGAQKKHTVKTKHDLLMSYINKKRSTGGVKP